MTTGSVVGAVGTHQISEGTRALSSLPEIDYVDLFTLDLGSGSDGGFGTGSGATPGVTPERWARAMFGDVPSVAEQVIWHGVLGLRLRSGRSPDTVGGWRIGGRGDGWIRLETESWFLSCNLLVQVAGDQVSLATFLRYDRSVGHVVWPPLAAIHRGLVPGVLRSAAARIRASRRSNGA
jgi:hypothetical protein